MKPAGQIKQQHSRRALFCTTTLSARLMVAHKCTELYLFFPPWEMFSVFKRFCYLLYVGFWHFYFSLNFPYVYQCVHLVCAFYDQPSSFLVLLLWQVNPLTVGYILKQSHSILSWALLTIHKVNPTGFFFFFFLTDAPFSQIFFFFCKSWAIPRAGNRNLVFPFTFCHSKQRWRVLLWVLAGLFPLSRRLRSLSSNPRSFYKGFFSLLCLCFHPESSVLTPGGTSPSIMLKIMTYGVFWI